jgi:hypothetical protein
METSANASSRLMRIVWSGRLLFEELGGGRWRLTHAQAPVQELILSGVSDSRALESAAARLDRCTELAIEWAADGAGVLLTLSGGSAAFTVGAAAAFLHESPEGLYAALQLPVFGGDARRFWRRVFRLVRLPGGRFIVRFLARRARGRRAM